ncbi:hypothetical protein ABE55_14370 [Bacillus thuringiensis]|uniref:toll/interleukin-1 receptor domain-containing protein n=1 Tax=Bacillus cereus group TaxID=86661 RepID=UPI00137515E6|nr:MULTISPECIES: toll/interleukin-1 receptor domain-containing protein [Bacillus cereus group]MBG9467715.1 hypothetical protein [Bacillus thuringiensis]
MNTNDFFISHATADAKLVSELVDFMESALKIERSKIYCTSGTGTRKMRTGNNFIENIKENVKGTKVVIFIFTPNYFKSNFCLAELGAAWALSSEVYPIIIPPTPRKLLKSTPLSESTQALTLNTYNDLITMADEFKEMDVAEYKSVQVLNERAHKLIDWIKENCSFDIDESVSKAEYLAVHDELEFAKKTIHMKNLAVEDLKKHYEDKLKFERAKFTKNAHVFGGNKETLEPEIEEEEETTYKWEAFDDYVKKVRSTLSGLDSIVLSAIYYDEFHQGEQFWPEELFFNWGRIKKLELENLIRIDSENQRITPNYDEYLVRKSLNALHDLLQYISSNIDEKMEHEFAEEHQFYLDFNSRKFWERILYINISV